MTTADKTLAMLKAYRAAHNIIEIASHTVTPEDVYNKAVSIVSLVDEAMPKLKQANPNEAAILTISFFGETPINEYAIKYMPYFSRRNEAVESLAQLIFTS